MAKRPCNPMKTRVMMAFSNSTMRGASIILFDPAKTA